MGHHPLSTNQCNKLVPPLQKPSTDSLLSFQWPTNRISHPNLWVPRAAPLKVISSCSPALLKRELRPSIQLRKWWCQWLSRSHLWLRLTHKNRCPKVPLAAKRYPRNQLAHPWTPIPKNISRSSSIKMAVYPSRSAEDRPCSSRGSRPMSSTVRCKRRLQVANNSLTASRRLTKLFRVGAAVKSHCSRCSRLTSRRMSLTLDSSYSVFSRQTTPIMDKARMVPRIWASLTRFTISTRSREASRSKKKNLVSNP